MKSVSWYITKLLFGSLFLTLFVVFVYVSFIAEYGHVSGVFLIRWWIATLIQFIASLVVYLNVRKDFRSNSFISILSFFLPQLIRLFYLAYTIWHEIMLGNFYVVEAISFNAIRINFWISFWLPYTLCMIASYIFFRRFCQRELGE